MRARDKVIHSLESVYREAFEDAQERGDEAQMKTLDFEFQRDQVMLEVLLDLRDALGVLDKAESEEESSLLDKAKAIRKFTKLGR